MVEDYCVRLDAFEGPLDLLLHLIRRAEVEVHDIPVAMIAEQYVKHLGQVHTIDIELAGEFLVMAATLMEIKSRLLTPQVRAAADGNEAAGLGASGDEDPRADLVRQLLEYKRHRDAAEALDARRITWQRRFPAGGAGFDRQAMAEFIAGAAQRAGEGAGGGTGLGVSGDASLDLALGARGVPGDGLDMDDLSLLDLVSAFAQIIAAVNFDRLGEHEVRYDDTPMELHQADILDRLARESPSGEMALLRVFEGRTRGEMVGMFIATLELVRQRRVRVRQETPGDPVLLCLAPVEDAMSVPADSEAGVRGELGEGSD
jgi:segregation and condensation protein A